MPITGYKIYRNGVLIASPTASPFANVGLTNGQLYSYEVSAVNEIGEGPRAGPVTATPTGSAPGLPIGGNQALRGIKAYALLGATATVASPYGITQIHAARDAAGVNGVVRFPAAGSPYLASPTMNKAGQTWQLESASTSITGDVTVAANDCLFEGGITRSFKAFRPAQTSKRFRCRNTRILNNSGYGVEMQGSNDDWRFNNVEITGQTRDFFHLWYDQGADGDIHGFRVDDSILIRTASAGPGLPSAMGGSDGNNLNQIYDFMVHNTYIDNGTGSQGGMGIEVWGNETNGVGVGGTVEYCDIKGGNDFLMSMVRSRDNWIHHNKLTVESGKAYACYESAGTNHLRGKFEYNTIINPGGGNHGAVIYHNNGALDMTLRQNTITNLSKVIDGCCNGGGYVVTDNCVVNTTDIIPGGGWAKPNTVARNGPTFGPCA